MNGAPETVLSRLVALGVAIAGAFGWVLRQIAGVRAESEKGRQALWDHINRTDQAVADHRVKAAEQFATKADVAALGDRMDRAFEQHEKRMTAAIRTELRNRGPIGPREEP